ncbi:hypothetical protein AV654_06265 [Paenibacillus elgii]|uniref:Uncharacterized protein n=1 Tax=Paenibacillus elgii TaxID=189691 RepID=A0A165PES7_9BACL|nr:hypothetical protein AV654_06265 [Paenibacillus elgii]
MTGSPQGELFHIYTYLCNKQRLICEGNVFQLVMNFTGYGFIQKRNVLLAILNQIRNGESSYKRATRELFPFLFLMVPFNDSTTSLASTVLQQIILLTREVHAYTMYFIYDTRK